MFKRKIISIILIIICTGFLLSAVIIYTNKTKTIIKISSTPSVFKTMHSSNSNSNSVNNSISISANVTKIDYNISKSDNFKITCSKLYSNYKNIIYMLKENYNNISLPILSFYEKPIYKYGLFDNNKSFWLIVNSPQDQKKYDIFVFYSLNQPKPIKVYESDVNESVANIDINYKNDIIEIISPSGIFDVSKYGQVTKY